MNDTCVVILNWNNHDLTLKLVKNMLSVESNADIIIVDNGSEDRGYLNTILKSINSIEFKVINEGNCLNLKGNDENQYNLILLDKNYGYAKGNNIGLKLGFNLGYKYLVVANNDVVLEAPVIETLKNDLIKNSKLAIVGPRVLSTFGKDQSPTMKVVMFDHFLYKIFFPILYPINKIWKHLYLKRRIKYKLSYPYTIMGCFFICDINKLKKVNYFDENTFLYFEENILSEKIYSMNWKVGFNSSVFIRHLHGTSTAELIPEKLQKIYLDSLIYYSQNYLGFNKFKIKLLRFSYFIWNKIWLQLFKLLKNKKGRL